MFNNREVIELKNKIRSLEEENEEMKEVIRQLKDVHAQRIDELKDKLRDERIDHEKSIKDLKEEYTNWIQETRDYNKNMGVFMEQIMAKDIELNGLMTKLIVK